MPDAYDANRKLITDPSWRRHGVPIGVGAGALLGQERFEELRQEALNREREKEDQKWLEIRDRVEPANNDSFSEITRKDPYDDDDDDDDDDHAFGRRQKQISNDDYEMSEDLTGAKELIKKFERPTTFTKEEENAQNFLDNYKMNLLS